jgi:hypothetical protein
MSTNRHARCQLVDIFSWVKSSSQETNDKHPTTGTGRRAGVGSALYRLVQAGAKSVRPFLPVRTISRRGVRSFPGATRQGFNSALRACRGIDVERQVSDESCNRRARSVDGTLGISIPGVHSRNTKNVVSACVNLLRPPPGLARRLAHPGHLPRMSQLVWGKDVVRSKL